MKGDLDGGGEVIKIKPVTWKEARYRRLSEAQKPKERKERRKRRHERRTIDTRPRFDVSMVLESSNPLPYSFFSFFLSLSLFSFSLSPSPSLSFSFSPSPHFLIIPFHSTSRRSCSRNVVVVVVVVMFLLTRRTYVSAYLHTTRLQYLCIYVRIYLCAYVSTTSRK